MAKVLDRSFSSEEKARYPKKNLLFFFYLKGFLFPKKKKLKGQMFLIASIFMILGFVLLRSLLTLPEITQEKTIQDTLYLDRTIDNIVTEYNYLTGLASLHSDVNGSAIDYFYNFTKYIRSEVDSQILYVFIYANESSNFSVTMGNFLQGNMSGTINFTGATPNGVVFSLNDTKDVTYHFEGSGWTNTTLNYTIGNTWVLDKFAFNSSGNYVKGFFDISLDDGGFFVRSKSTYNRTWTNETW